MNNSNMALDDMLQELTKYGRPSLNQFAISASLGNTAGIWNVEVWIPSKKEAPAEAGTGRRMIGRGTLYEAANCCLNECQELAESTVAVWYNFISEDEIKEIENNKNNLK